MSKIPSKNRKIPLRTIQHRARVHHADPAEICSGDRHDHALRPQEQPHCAASSFRGPEAGEAGAVEQEAHERGWVGRKKPTLVTPQLVTLLGVISKGGDQLGLCCRVCPLPLVDN